MRKQRKPTRTQIKKPRTNIPLGIKLQVLAESGYMCANPRCKHILTLELHHLEWVRDGGGNEPSNLIALCSNCHDLHTRGHIPKNALDAWKQMLLLVNGSLDRESLDILLFLYKFEKKSLDLDCKWNEWEKKKQAELEQLKENPETTQRQLKEAEEKWKACEPPRSREHPIQVTGDGLLRLVRLIRTGLVDEGNQDVGGSDWLYIFYWEPTLTTIGRRLAEAFINGDAKVFRELLVGQSNLVL
jgi:hypothetical protein